MVGFIKGLGNLFTMITQGLLVTWQNLKVVWSQSHINCVKMTLKYLPPSSLLHLKMNTIMNVQFLLTRKRINSYLYMLQVIFWIFFLKKLFVVSTPLNHLDLDDCKNFEVTDEVSVWIHNGADALCLSHFYFDIFDIKTAKFKGKLFSFLVYCLSILLNALLIIGSYSSIYHCKFDKDAASKNVDTNGISLLCSAWNTVVNYLV